MDQNMPGKQLSIFDFLPLTLMLLDTLEQQACLHQCLLNAALLRANVEDFEVRTSVALTRRPEGKRIFEDSYCQALGWAVLAAHAAGGGTLFSV
jgi:hypothetical protein